MLGKGEAVASNEPKKRRGGNERSYSREPRRAATGSMSRLRCRINATAMTAGARADVVRFAKSDVRVESCFSCS